MQAAPRAKRQPVWHILAGEFGSSSLHEKGAGEFDPSFVITKLGARVNRVLVAGLLERIELVETSTGSTLYQGQLRDPSGLHYFSVGDYASESTRELTMQFAERTEIGEPILVMMTAKARSYQTDEGAVYTSIRPEEMCEVTRADYAVWLARACEDTLTRLDIYSRSLDIDSSAEAMRAGGLPDHMVEGLIASRNHYGDIDTETFRLHVMQALDIAEGKLDSASQPAPAPLPMHGDTGEGGESSAGSGEELKQVLLSFIQQLDQGEGVDFETLLSNASARGFDRDSAEEALDELSDSGSVLEPRFGWFRLV